MHQNTSGKGARPTRLGGPEGQALTRTHADLVPASSDQQEEASASTRNSPCATADNPVRRRTVRETGRVTDRVHMRKTTAPHTAQDRKCKDPQGKMPQQGPKRVQHGASPAPSPRGGASGRHHEPGSWPASTCPAQPPSKTGGGEHPLGEGTGTTGKPTGAPRATGPDEARRTKAGPQATPKRRAVGPNQSTRPAARQPRPPGPANPGNTHNTKSAQGLRSGALEGPLASVLW